MQKLKLPPIKPSLKVKANCSYIGTTGYNQHSRDFFRALSKKVDVQIRNFTVGKHWGGNVDEPHNKEPYITKLDKKLLIQQELWNSKQELETFPIYPNYPNSFIPDVDIILNEVNHHFYYQDYNDSKYKIAYVAWEFTKYPEKYFNRLKEFDQVWVPSKWQAECSIEQGLDVDKVKVVPEGVNGITFKPVKFKNTSDYKDGRFKFLIFGRWDHRKSTKEIIQTFLKEFSSEEPVDLIISVDNPYSNDGFNSTEERLFEYDLQDPRIKIKHFPSREDYITFLQNGHVFVSCARSEGWNLPLIEAMACGTPSIYSNCSGQLEFAEGKGLPVKIIGETPIDKEMDNFFGASQTEIGNYYSPDFEDLAKVMRDAYQNYDLHKEKALKESKEIIETFTWENATNIAVSHLKKLPRKLIPIKLNIPQENKIDISFIEKAKVNISGHDLSKKYRVDFYNHETQQHIWGDTLQLHQFDGNGEPSSQSGGVWTAPNASYYVKWRVEVKDEYGNLIKQHIFDCKDKKVYIHLDSKAIGDTIAWFPYVEKFKKLHGCKIVCSTFHNEWFKSLYPEIEFVSPGSQVHDIYAMYKVGWFYGEDGKFDGSKNPIDFLSIPLQKTASDILGLPFQEVKPQINVNSINDKLDTKYVTLSMQSTCQAKYWNHPSGWQEVVDFLNGQGYKVILIDKHTSFGVENFINHSPKNVIDKSSCSLNEAFNYIKNAHFHIGISSGLSWVSWALNTPVLMVSSFSQPHCEFQSDCVRIYNDTPTSGYFNTHRLDSSNWNWYPHKEIKSMEDWYEIETITPTQVINNIKLYLL